VIVIKIEMWPGGDEKKAFPLASGIIFNDATGTPESGNYVGELRDKSGRRWRKVCVQAFPRRRLMAWDLLYRILKEAVSDRNDRNDQVRKGTK